MDKTPKPSLGFALTGSFCNHRAAMEVLHRLAGDWQIVPILSLGGLGVISVLSNVAPAKAHAICQSWFDGDVKKAAQLQLEAVDLIDSLFCEVNPIPVKTALNLMGKKVGPLRSPMCEMEEKNVERLKKSMQAYGIL